jgi:hypothetical protein
MNDVPPSEPPARLSRSEVSLAKKHPAAGPVVEVFRPWKWLGLLAPVSLLVLLLAGYVAVQVHSSDRREPVSPLLDVALITVIILSLVWGLMAFLASQARVLVCENALLVAEGGGGKRQTWLLPWDDVAAVYYDFAGVPGAPDSVRGSVKVETAEGRLRQLPRGLFPHYSAITQAVVDRVKERMLRDVLERLERGEPVDFGRHVELSPDGLRWTEEPVDWEDIEKVSWRIAGRGRDVNSVVSLIGRRWMRPVPSADVPNVPILLEVLRSRYGVEVTTESGVRC